MFLGGPREHNGIQYPSSWEVFGSLYSNIFCRLNFPGLVTQAFFVGLNVREKVWTLAVGFPTQMVDVGITIYYAHTNLCTELKFCGWLCFWPLDVREAGRCWWYDWHRSVRHGRTCTAAVHKPGELACCRPHPCDYWVACCILLRCSSCRENQLVLPIGCPC